MPELEQLLHVPPKTTTTVHTNEYEIVSKAKKVYQYDIKWTGECKKGKKFDTKKQTVKLQLKQNALLSVFYKTLLHQHKDFFGISEGTEQYIYDSGSMFFCQTKLLDDKEARTFDLEVEKLDRIAKDYYRSRNDLLVARGLAVDGANRCFFECNGKKTDVAQYFFDKYHIQLRYPDLPCVIEKKGRNKSFFPIEVLRIPENQRDPKAKQGNVLNAMIIRKCQILSSVAVEKNREDADILNSNLIIKNTGARVDPRKLVSAAAANQIPTPNRLEPRKAEDFVNQFIRRVELYGVRVEHRDLFDWSNPDRDSELLEDYAKKGYDFALIIGDTDRLHHGVKFMELSTKLPTQHVTTKT
uniref:PAZ domain-containing protein n=1 Tax=Panagrolaimus davidi TaxID=227884 RepID=A0A914RDX6_9BILA